MKRRHKTPASRPARLFAEPERPADACIANIDGASRGNPGPASYGVLIRRPDGGILPPLRKYLGCMTNNVAEYYALIAALDYATSHGIKKLRVLSDSELLVQQVRGSYKVRNAKLRPLHEQATKLARGLAYFSIEYIPRAQNAEADQLANAALDRTAEPSAVSSRPSAGASATGIETRKSNASTSLSTRVEIRPEKKKIRARYRNGALHPAEPIDLAEGEQVEITIYKPRL